MLDEKGMGYFVPGEETIFEFDISKAGPGALLLKLMFCIIITLQELIFLGYLQSEILTQYGEVKSVAEHTDRRYNIQYHCEVT